MIPMGERVRQAGDKAVSMLMENQAKAVAEAFQALEALSDEEGASPDITEANRRIGNIIRVLLTGER